MYNLRSYPFIWIFLFYIVGASLFYLDYSYWLSSLLSLLVFILIWINFRSIKLIFFGLFFLLFGYFYTQISHLSEKGIIYNPQNTKNKWIVKQKKVSNSIKYEVFQFKNSKIKGLIYSNKIEDSLNIGDTIEFLKKVRWQTPSFKVRPLSFDYSKYLIQKNIYNIAFLNKYVKLKVYPNTVSSTKNYYLSKVDNNKNISQSSKNFIKAIILGDKNSLSKDDDTIDTFRNIGLIHVLAISGLHIGVLFMFFDFLGLLLLSLTKIRGKRFIPQLMACIPLWIYIWILDFPISAVRGNSYVYTCGIGQYDKSKIF